MRLYLLRHGEVASHRGDVPITETARAMSFEVGRALGDIEPGRVRVLTGETRRATETADHLVTGMREAGATVVGPEVAFALRNPDLYVNGVRVNMVSSAETLATQVEGLQPADVASLDFFPDFFASPDRIGWWLSHRTPPGEDAAQVAARMRSFVVSLDDPTQLRCDAVVAVTHSPLLRAVGLAALDRDIGEPEWVSGLLLEVTGAGIADVAMFTPEGA